jgi:hypothetical protein
MSTQENDTQEKDNTPTSTPLAPQPAPGDTRFRMTAPVPPQLDPTLPQSPDDLEEMGAPDEVVKEVYGSDPQSPTGMFDPQADALRAAKAASND